MKEGDGLITVLSDRCTGCGLCEQVCTNLAIKVVKGKARVYITNCTGCMDCVEVCPEEAILELVEATLVAEADEISRVPEARVPARTNAVITATEPAPRTGIWAGLGLLGRELLPLVEDWFNRKAQADTLTQHVSDTDIRPEARAGRGRGTPLRDGSGRGRGRGLGRGRGDGRGKGRRGR